MRLFLSKTLGGNVIVIFPHFSVSKMLLLKSNKMLTLYTKNFKKLTGEREREIIVNTVQNIFVYFVIFVLLFLIFPVFFDKKLKKVFTPKSKSTHYFKRTVNKNLNMSKKVEF